MKKIVIAGAGHMGLSASKLLDPNRVEFLGFADNDPAKWTLEDGSYPEASEKAPVFSIQTAVDLAPDEFIISAIGKERARAIEEQLKVCRFYGNIMKLHELYEDFDIRSRCLKELAGRIDYVPGAVAELGVYQGDIAWQINALLPDRQFYLFDTFEGFTEEDIATEKAFRLSAAEEGEFSDTTVGAVLDRLPHPEKCHIRKGHFPETAAGLAHAEFAFVSIDPDLYEPAKAGIEFFYPRLNEGGILIIHDYNNTRFKGIHQAVKEYERKLVEFGEKPLKLVPLGDLHGSCVIIK